jgi:hypothetical protein
MAMRHPPGVAEALNGRKRSSFSTNSGIYRSVVDYDTEDELRAAMVAAQNNPSNSMAALMAAIEQGEPVQKVWTPKWRVAVK